MNARFVELLSRVLNDPSEPPAMRASAVTFPDLPAASAMT